MNANEQLARMRVIAAQLTGSRLGLVRRVDAGEQLAALFIELHEHIAAGGKLPKAWRVLPAKAR
jgi:hypothetical protein